MCLPLRLVGITELALTHCYCSTPQRSYGVPLACQELSSGTAGLDRGPVARLFTACRSVLTPTIPTFGFGESDE